MAKKAPPELKRVKQSESVVLNQVFMLCAFGANKLFRNHQGAAKKGNVWIRFGIGGTGGSDTLGWRSYVIRPEDVGKRIAVFAALEVKKTGELCEVDEDQVKFLVAVDQAGGIAGAVDDAMHAKELLDGWRPK